MTAKPFGQVGESPVLEIEIGSKAGARAKILTWGAVLRDLVVPLDGGLQRVTLGLNSIEDYVAAFAEFRRRAGPVRQPHRQRPLHARRRRL